MLDEIIRELPEGEVADEHSSLQAEDEFSSLKSLLESSEWPCAVPDLQIADENSETDKDDRAEGIVDILLPPLAGKKFLDFGCGEGHVANYVSKFAEISVGYDLTKPSKSRFSWEEENEKLILTTDFKAVKKKSPYDLVLIYDVLDHAQNSSPVEILTDAKSVLADDGKIFLRTHPWSSRHGGHAYRKINKAFVHLVFSEDELLSMGLNLETNLKVLAPQGTYKDWINDSGLKFFHEPEPELQDIEAFFKNNSLVKGRILKKFNIDSWGGCPDWQMSQCFWDYVLEKK